MTTQVDGFDCVEKRIREMIKDRTSFTLRNDVCSIDISYNVRRGTWNIFTAVYGCVIIKQYSYRRPIVEDGHLILEGMSENLSIEINPANLRLCRPMSTIEQEGCRCV